LIESTNSVENGNQNALIELISGEGRATTEEARQLQYTLRSGGISPTFFTDVKRGNKTMDQAVTEYLEALELGGRSQESMAISVGDNSFQTKQYLNSRQAAILLQKRRNGQQSDIERQRQTVIDATDDANAAAAKTRRSL
jgi:hypothetical protein